MATRQENTNEKVQSENPILRFPSTLGQEKHKNIISFSCIGINNREIQDRSQYFTAKPKFKYNNAGGVYMYMPVIDSGITYQQQYSDEDKSLLQKLMGAIQGASGFGDGLQKVASTLVAGVEFGGVREDLTNDIENTHVYAKYEGPALRTLSLTFNLMARNREELQTIAEIIHFFKINSATEYDAGFARLQYPSQFVIEELSQSEERIVPPLKFGPAYCTKVTRQDMTSGAQFDTGDATEYVLTLDFTEVRILTKKDIEIGM